MMAKNWCFGGQGWCLDRLDGTLRHKRKIRHVGRVNHLENSQSQIAAEKLSDQDRLKEATWSMAG